MFKTGWVLGATLTASVLALTSCGVSGAESSADETVRNAGAEELAETVHGNQLSFVFTDGTELYGVTPSPPGQEALQALYNSKIACGGVGKSGSPFVGRTTSEQGAEGGRCVEAQDVQPNGTDGIIIRSGRHDSTEVVDGWKEMYSTFSEKPSAATNAINTKIEAFNKDQGALVNGFAKEMNFWAVVDLNFDTKVGNIRCNNVLLGQQGNKPLVNQWQTTSFKDQAEDFAEAAGKYLKQSLQEGGPDDPFSDILIATEISSDLEDAAFGEVDETNTWWVAQLTPNADTSLQGFAVPPDPSGASNGYYELAVPCSNDMDSANNYLLMLRPFPKDQHTDDTDHIHARMVTVPRLNQ